VTNKIDDEYWFMGNEYYFMKAGQQAEFSDCVRRKVGAILISSYNGVILASAHNSAPNYASRCHECPRSMSGVEPYAPYDSGQGICYAVHAEARILLAVRSSTRDGMIMFVTCEPCHNCKILIAECRVEARWPGNAGSVGRQSPKVEPGFFQRVNRSETQS
jgi:deoxycytidylate deaminase